MSPFHNLYNFRHDSSPHQHRFRRHSQSEQQVDFMCRNYKCADILVELGLCLLCQQQSTDELILTLLCMHICVRRKKSVTSVFCLLKII